VDVLRYAAQRLRSRITSSGIPRCSIIVIDRPIRSSAACPARARPSRQPARATRGCANAWWEAVAPVPAPGDEPTAEEIQPAPYPRGKEWDITDMLVPYQKIMHEFTPDHISEDIELQALDSRPI